MRHELCFFLWSTIYFLIKECIFHCLLRQYCWSKNVGSPCILKAGKFCRMRVFFLLPLYFCRVYLAISQYAFLRSRSSSKIQFVFRKESVGDWRNKASFVVEQTCLHKGRNMKLSICCIASKIELSQQELWQNFPVQNIYLRTFESSQVTGTSVAENHDFLCSMLEILSSYYSHICSRIWALNKNGNPIKKRGRVKPFLGW